MKKYTLWNNEEEIVFDCDNGMIFNTTIQVNYPLGDFNCVWSAPEWITISFSNYKIVIQKQNKGVYPLFFIKNFYTQVFKM